MSGIVVLFSLLASIIVLGQCGPMTPFVTEMITTHYIIRHLAMTYMPLTFLFWIPTMIAGINDCYPIDPRERI
jgi:hypothetical protein